MNKFAAGVVTGRGVVVTLSATDAPLVFDKLTDLEGQPEAAGNPEHDTVMLEVYSGCGVNWTVYVAVSPACAITWLLGLTDMLKSVICAGTEVCASTILPGATACTVPPLKDNGEAPLLFGVGVAVTLTVTVAPDCSDTGPQLMLALNDPPAPQVPVLMLALTLLRGIPVACGLKSARITMLLARSGPLFVTV